MAVEKQVEAVRFILLCPKCGALFDAAEESIDSDGEEEQYSNLPALITIRCLECGYVDVF